MLGCDGRVPEAGGGPLCGAQGARGTAGKGKACARHAWFPVGRRRGGPPPDEYSTDGTAMTVLYGLVMAGVLWSFMGLALVPLLTALLSRTYTVRRLGVGLLLFGTTWLILWLDPGGRLAWFGD